MFWLDSKQYNVDLIHPNFGCRYPETTHPSFRLFVL